MGRVLLAHDPVLDRDVAIKHLRDDLKIPRDTREGLVTRMRHEARAAARVAHPNLIVLHDMGEDPVVGLFLVFEYIQGLTLKQHLLAEGRLPPADCARLSRELGAALTVAHEAGILHRDVKPENIMLAKTGGKIADFGIARIPDSTLTHQGGLMGTPAYSAPETFRAGKFSPASDQFSLAASIYEALSGRRAFPGDDAVSVAARISSEPPEPFAASIDLPPAVDSVLARGLERLPEDRFPSCAVFGATLARSLSFTSSTLGLGQRTLTDGALAARTSSAGGTAELPIPRERRTGQMVVGALLVLGTAALVVRTALRSAESGAAPAAAVMPDPPASVVSIHTARAHVPLLVPSVSHAVHPHLEASAVPSGSAAAVASSDAGPAVPASAPAVPLGSASAGVGH
jgi:serine/threonine protein kinase